MFFPAMRPTGMPGKRELDGRPLSTPTSLNRNFKRLFHGQPIYYGPDKLTGFIIGPNDEKCTSWNVRPLIDPFGMSCVPIGAINGNIDQEAYEEVWKKVEGEGDLSDVRSDTAETAPELGEQLDPFDRMLVDDIDELLE